MSFHQDPSKQAQASVLKCVKSPLKNTLVLFPTLTHH